ncbi:polarity establishment/cellular polarization [Diaporthe australafricana]|uniref:Polarity establishment/cellular polarization n=1 Tax=Diaporthe australafricana TaxID=127596 RepID=A0ABR3WMY0_9PEZI
MLPTSRRILLLLASASAALVEAAPTISFPINSQVPPVARISQPFSYVFASTTFTSSSGSPLSYSLSDPPSWLSVDSDRRRLYGTPQDADIAPGTVVGVPITLVANDTTGSTPLAVTLVVSRNPGPAVNVPVSDQIRSFGTYSEPASILLYPDRIFVFAFAPDTFIDTQTPDLNFYAVTADNSPLPAWVSFDEGTLAFAGTTPPFASLIEPPQTFSLKLIASDVTGFSAASIAFSIVVGSHALTASQPRITLNATAGQPVAYTGLAGNIRIDGQPAAISDVSRATTENLPSWLFFDPSLWAIAGTPPATAESTSFSVIMEDDFSDRLNVTFDVEVAGGGGLFQAIFPTLSVESGDQLSFDLKPFLLDPSDSEITVDVQPSTSWIEFDASSLVLSGDVPILAPSSVIEVVFNVKAATRRFRRDDTAQSQKLTIQILSISDSTPMSTGGMTPASSTTSTASAATSSKGSDEPGDHQPAHNATTNVVLVAVLVPVILGLLFAICFCFCCYRRRQRRLSRTPLEGKESCGPETTNYIHTQGYDPEASRLDLRQHFSGLAKSPVEKTKPRKPSNLRSEYIGSPVPEAPAPALPIIVHDAPTQDPVSSKYRDLMAPLRNFRIPRLKRGNTRASNDSFDEDDGRGFSMDNPPSITLRQSRQNSFRSEVEVSIPSLDSEHSPLQTPDVAYTRSTTRHARDSGHYYPFPATPTDRGPPPRNPARVQSEPRNRDITPIDQSEIFIEKTRPAADEPKIREHPALRHAKSQRSFLRFSSVDTFRGTRRLAGKATASAKGAASLASAAVQRKTLKAWGKVRLHVQDSPHARQGIFDNVVSSRTHADFGRFGHFGGSNGYVSLRDPGVPETVPTPRVATAPMALNSESHRRRQSRMNGSISSDSRSSRAMSIGAAENRMSRSEPGTVLRRRGSGSYDMPQLPTASPRSSCMGLGIADYEGLVYESPFHPSRDRGRGAGRATTTSWATTQARLSMASSALDRPVTAKTAQTAQTASSMRDSRNWVVHQESPMESPMESPVLPGSRVRQEVGGVSTPSEMTPSNNPFARSTGATPRQGGGVGGGGGGGGGNEIKRKSVAQSGKSGTSRESDGPPAFI